MASLIHSSNVIANKSESFGYKDSANIIRYEDDNDDDEPSQFHTWEVGEDSTIIQNSQVIEEPNEPSVVVGVLQKSKSVYIHSDSEDEDEGLDELGEMESGKQLGRAESASGKKKEENLDNPMSPTRVPSEVLQLRPLVSEEVIAEKEASIRNLFFKCKDLLMTATVFHMTAKYEDKVVNGDEMLQQQAVEGINDEECLRENPSKLLLRKPKTADIVSDENNKNKTNTELLLEKYEESKQSNETLAEDVKLKLEEPVVRISIPKAIDEVKPKKAEYKPLMHSAIRSNSPVVTTSSAIVVNNTTIDTSDMPTPPAQSTLRAASPSVKANNVNGASSGAASPSTQVTSKLKESTSRKIKSTPASGGIAAQFSADMAKLAAPLGSGLTRHGTKIKGANRLRSDVNNAASSNTATFMIGDNVQNLLNSPANFNNSQSGSGKLAGNSNSIQSRSESNNNDSILNVKITKRENKQAFIDASFAVEDEAVAESKNPSSPERPSEKKDSKDESPKARVLAARREAKQTSPIAKDPNAGFGRFKNNSSMVVDSRGVAPVDSEASPAIRNSYRPEGVPYTPTTVNSVFQRSFSEPTNLIAELPSPTGGLSGSSTPRSPAPRNPGIASTIRAVQQMPMQTGSTNFKNFKIPQQARQAINTNSHGALPGRDNLQAEISALEKEILRLSAVRTDNNRPPTASPRPQPSHSASELVSPSKYKNVIDDYDDSGDEGQK